MCKRMQKLTRSATRGPKRSPRHCSRTAHSESSIFVLAAYRIALRSQQHWRRGSDCNSANVGPEPHTRSARYPYPVIHNPKRATPSARTEPPRSLSPLPRILPSELSISVLLAPIYSVTHNRRSGHPRRGSKSPGRGLVEELHSGDSRSSYHVHSPLR